MPPGSGQQSITITIPAVPVGWDFSNTLVLVSIADGGYGQIEQAKLTSLTTIVVQENVVNPALHLYKYIIFKI